MNRRQKIKAWCSDHKEELATAGIAAGILGLLAAAFVLEDKMYKAQVAEEQARQKQLLEAFNRGAGLLPNSDGSFWIIERPKNAV